MKDWGYWNICSCHAWEVKVRQVCIISQSGHFIPVQGIQKGETEKVNVGDFLVLHPGAWGLPGLGLYRNRLYFKTRHQGNVHPPGKGPGLQVRKVTRVPSGKPCLAPLHTQLSALPLSAPTRPSLGGRDSR